MKRFTTSLIFTFFILFPSISYATTARECCMVGNAHPEQCLGQDDTEQVACIKEVFTPAQFFDSPSSIFNIFLSNLLLVAGIILFLLVVLAGFQMIQAGSSGDAHAMEKWRMMLLYGIIGFVIILFAGAIIKIIEVFTGVNILNPEAVLNQ